MDGIIIFTAVNAPEYVDFPVVALTKSERYFDSVSSLCGDAFDEAIKYLKGTGHKTLKKYLIECRVPVEDRDRLVVAAVGQEIIWIPCIANARWETESSGSEDPAPEQGWLYINIE